MNIKTLFSLNPLAYFIQSRSLSLAVKQRGSMDDLMDAWQIHSYGGLDEVKLSKVKSLEISKPSDVLVKINASSVNPIDIAMIDGYGSTVLNLMRKLKGFEGRSFAGIEFPLTLGRDFAGTIISKGHDVKKLNIGDKVWGVVPVEQQGCHREYVLVDSSLVSVHPEHLTYIEAASILYAGLTAWSALWYSGGLSYNLNPTNKRVLVLGGSGGVGNMAIQLLKAWNLQIITTCSTDAVQALLDLGADVVVDYKQEDADSKVIAAGPYNIILDCCNQGIESVKSKGYIHSKYVTLNSPMLKNIDESGLVCGSVRNIGEFLKYNMPFLNKSSLKWAFFTPSPKGIELIHNLVEQKKICPKVQQVYTFNELPDAYKKVKNGHLRGKIVIDMKRT